MKAEAVVLPREVRDLAARLGARGDDDGLSVRLRQRGTMRNRPGERAMRFRATETISLRRTEFAWRAATGPFGFISVTDQFLDGEVWFAVRAFGRLRIAGARGGHAAGKGEIMRYLAELAWAPDAILHNRSLQWTVAEERLYRVSAGRDAMRGEVALRLNEKGRIESVQAEDRPRKEGSGFVPRPWRGRFFDYRAHRQRWLPLAAEVGWVVSGQFFTTWSGEMLDWTCVQLGPAGVAPRSGPRRLFGSLARPV